MRCRSLLLLLAPVLIALLPATAAAQSCEAPPGTAALDEYCETVPAADGQGGGTAGRGASGDRADSGGSSSASAVEQRLRSAGPTGAALLAVRTSKDRSSGNDTSVGRERRDRSAASTSKARESRAAGRDGDAAEPQLPAPSDNPLRAVVRAASNGSGIGVSFGWVLALSALLLVSVSWVRFRRRSSS
jgi:cobalamin biosynthesis Mg chelatase CobN